MIFSHIKFHMPKSNGSLVIVVKINFSHCYHVVLHYTKKLPEQKLHILQLLYHA
jgi:hypothetical protein